MKEIKEKERARTVYVPPRIEVYATSSGRLLGTSFFTDEHNPGVDQDGDSDHNSGNLKPVENGAKQVILGQEFSFSDLWEE